MLNCIIIQGRLKADPELRYTQSNKAVVSLTLAVNRSRKDQDGNYPTDWIDVVLWGNTAEHAAKYFQKGDMALIRGRLESRDWEDKSGSKRRSWEVQAESIDFCGKRENPRENSGFDVRSANPANISADDFSEFDSTDESDVPF